MTSLDDVAILVFRKNVTEEGYADAIVELASELGLLEGRDPSVLRNFLLSEKGRVWLKQKLVPVHLSTLMEASA